MIRQKTTVSRNSESNPFSVVLKEAFEGFKSEYGFAPLTDFQSLLGDDALFESYAGYLTEGLDPNDIPVVHQFYDNLREEMLNEALTSQVTPIAGLSMGAIRAMWPRTAVKDIFPTEVATVPSFSIAWQAPYIRTADGEKYYLPKAVVEQPGLVDMPPLYNDDVDVPSTGNILTLTVINGVACSMAKRDAVDLQVAIKEVTMALPDDSSDPDGTTSEVVVNCHIKRDIQGNFVGTVVGTGADGTAYEDTIFGSMDCETGEFKLTSVSGYITKAKFAGRVTQEANNTSVSVSFDIKREEIQIGTGAHFNARATRSVVK